MGPCIVIIRTDKCILVTSGGVNDVATLHKVLLFKITAYQDKTGTQISTESIAQMLSNTLYYRRFFPYYTFNILGGLDRNGTSVYCLCTAGVGCVYRYDAVGSFEKTTSGVAGTGTEMVEPLLDSIIGGKNRSDSKTNKPNLTSIDACNLVIDAMRSASQRKYCDGTSVNIR